MQRLSRRVTAWRVTIAFCFVSVSLHLGWIFYLALDAKFGAMSAGPAGRLVTAVCLLLGFIPPVLLLGALGFRFARRMVERRLPMWVDQIAALYGVEPSALDAAAAPWRKDDPDAP